MPDGAPLARWEAVTVTYPGTEQPAVGPVTLDLRAGERVLLLGASGSGKSTLLNALTGLVPQSLPADMAGRVEVMGRDVASALPSAWSGTVARLFQKAEQTLCGMIVGDEIAFALENRGLPEAEIRARVSIAMKEIGLPEDWLSRRTSRLSGGERQLVALAAARAQGAPIFVADEPTAHLAPAVARRLERLIAEVTPDGAVLVVDHRFDELIARIDRVVVIGVDGRVVAEGSPRHVFREHGKLLGELGVWRPPGSGLDERLCEAGISPDCAPLTLAEALAAIDPPPAGKTDAARAAVRGFLSQRVAPPMPLGAKAVRLQNAACAPLFARPVLRGLTLDISGGEAVAILGANGAGKSTLAASLAGLLRLKGGTRSGKPGALSFQNPDNQFLSGSVADELRAVLDGPADTAEAIAAAWGLEGFLGRHPFELSEGQKRRLSLALVTAGDRFPLIVMDEPTGGLDAAGVANLAGHVGRLRREGRALAIVTHDMDFALATCPRWLILGEGRVLADGPAAELMGDRALLERAGLAPPVAAEAVAWMERHGAC